MQLAHAGDDRLTGLFVGVNLEGRVFFGQLLDRGAQLLLVGLRLRLDRDLDDWGRERHRLKDDRLLLVGERLARGRVLEAHHGDDLAGADRRDLLTLVGVHLVDLADPLLAALGHVEDHGAGLEPARVDAHERQLAEVRVRGDLEGQAGERLGLAGLAGVLDRLVFGVVALDRADVDRRRQEVDHCVEQRLDALVLERRAAHHRVEQCRERRATDTGLDVGDADVLALEVGVCDVVVGVRERLERASRPPRRRQRVRRGSPRRRSPRR